MCLFRWIYWSQNFNEKITGTTLNNKAYDVRHYDQSFWLDDLLFLAIRLLNNALIVIERGQSQNCVRKKNNACIKWIIFLI